MRRDLVAACGHVADQFGGPLGLIAEHEERCPDVGFVEEIEQYPEPTLDAGREPAPLIDVDFEPLVPVLEIDREGIGAYHSHTYLGLPATRPPQASSNRKYKSCCSSSRLVAENG